MTDQDKITGKDNASTEDLSNASETNKPAQMPKEIGGQKGPEPTRYGDWEKGGIISDF